jgi:hypothetical protein
VPQPGLAYLHVGAARDQQRRQIVAKKAAELAFSFRPLPEGSVTKDDDRVLFGPGMGGFAGSEIRLQAKLHDKAKKKYDLRGKPYAIVVGVHDPMCDIDDFFDALIGHEAVVVATGDWIRKRDGFFGRRSRREARGKNTRVSCVYAVQEWLPGGSYDPRITRFDNPFAEMAFPLDCLPLDAHWSKLDGAPTHVRYGWLTQPVQRNPWLVMS